MKVRLQRIEITNFKAFREFTLDLDGRHLLVYGDNGAGKSSLYWALYTFLQSARKPKHSIAKYFDPTNDERLLNIHEQASPAPRPGKIILTLRDTATSNDTTYPISQTDHGTFNQPTIRKGELASDFITYRFFFGFSDFRNSEKFNIWPLFEREILPFCISTGGNVPIDEWNAIKSGDPNPYGSRGLGGSYSYDNFKAKTAGFAALLPGIVDSISAEAQRFYDAHFAAGDPAKVTLKVGVTTLPAATGSSQQDFQFTIPVVEFGIQVEGKTVARPQAFLNEAKMTQLALSVRFAASIVNLHESDLKLLVLDDLLVSLDMSNRMKIVEILLRDAALANYQKIILTHDLGFFHEFKRIIGGNHHMWLFQKLVGNAKDGPTVSNVKSELERAQQFLANDEIAECGNQLRKCVEANLTYFLEQAKQKKGIDPLIDRKAFATLHQKLNEASSELSLGSYKEFADLLQAEFTLEQLRELASPDEIDPAKFAAATKDEKKKKGALIAKLYAARPNLHQSIIDLLSDASRKRLNALKLLEEVRRIKDRILNPASHAGAAPLYTKEAEDAIKIIQALGPALDAALATL